MSSSVVLRPPRGLFRATRMLLLVLLPTFSRTVAADRPAHFPPRMGTGVLASQVKLDQHTFPEAKCLDGSPPLYYVRDGWGSGKDSWVLYHEGMGFCGDDKSCLDRSKWAWGSSKYEYEAGFSDKPDSGTGEFYTDLYPPEEKEDAAPRGPRGDHAEDEAPRSALRPEEDAGRPAPWSKGFLFDPKIGFVHNWNLVLLRYCDGGYMSGERRDPVVVKGGNTTLHYRGRFISEAVLESLSTRSQKRGNYPLSEADRVIITGCSSGAIRSLLHLDALAAMIGGEEDAGDHPPGTSSTPRRPLVVGFSDSGFYLDNAMYELPKEYIVSPAGHNATALLNSECMAEQQRLSKPLRRCAVSAIAAGFVRTPFYSFQSRYDTDQRTGEISPECANSPKCVEEYGMNLTAEFDRIVLSNKSVSGRGVGPRAGFLDSCSRHCTARTAHLPRGDRTGRSPVDLFGVWMEELLRSGRKDGERGLRGTEGGGGGGAEDGVPTARDASDENLLVRNGAEDFSDGQESKHFPCDDCCPAAFQGKRGAGTVEEAILYA